MANILGKIFSVGAEKLVTSITSGLDSLITNKEEKLEAERKIQELVTKHVQEMEKLSNEQLKTEVEDRASARSRETEFVKALGHADYMQWVLVIFGCASFGYMIYMVLNGEIPDKNREWVFHIFGIIEGAMLVNIYQYYFGSSQGSRFKDMKK